MPTYDASQVECLVFSFKEGLLSKIAHDLKIRVETLELTVDGDSVEARFDAGSLRVVCARKDGRDASGTLSGGDKKKIEKNLREDVLHARRHPDVRFRSTKIERAEAHADIEGELTLHGVTRTVRARATLEGGRWVSELTLHQPDFGIKPYSAMLGTLKIQPDVRVRVSVAAE